MIHCFDGKTKNFSKQRPSLYIDMLNVTGDTDVGRSRLVLAYLQHCIEIGFVQGKLTKPFITNSPDQIFACFSFSIQCSEMRERMLVDFGETLIFEANFALANHPVLFKFQIKSSRFYETR